MADLQLHPRLKSVYRTQFVAAMREEFGYKNDMMIPRLDKIVSEHRLWC